jgi:nucleotide-binding universal stress UspA family protein
MYKNILVGYDGSEGAKTALLHGINLAKQLNSKLTALWIKGTLPHFPETVDEIQSEELAAVSYFKKLSKEVHQLSNQYSVEIRFEQKSGHPAKTIIDYAKLINADLIVLGHKGHSSLWGSLLGHTTDKVSESAACSVLIVR